MSHPTTQTGDLVKNFKNFFQAADNLLIYPLIKDLGSLTLRINEVQADQKASMRHLAVLEFILTIPVEAIDEKYIRNWVEWELNSFGVFKELGAAGKLSIFTLVDELLRILEATCRKTIELCRDVKFKWLYRHLLEWPLLVAQEFYGINEDVENIRVMVKERFGKI